MKAQPHLKTPGERFRAEHMRRVMRYSRASDRARGVVSREPETWDDIPEAGRRAWEATAKSVGYK